MSMFGGYSAALSSPATSSPVASNRSTTATAHANSTAGLGAGMSGVLGWAVVAIIIALALLVTGRFTLSNIRIA